MVFTYYNHYRYNLGYTICDNLYCNGSVWKGIIDESMKVDDVNYGKYQFMRKVSNNSLSIIYVNETSGDLKYAYCTISVDYHQFSYEHLLVIFFGFLSLILQTALLLHPTHFLDNRPTYWKV